MSVLFCLAPIYTVWQHFHFKFNTQIKEEKQVFQDPCARVDGSCRHKQLFCVALHLLWALLISSQFSLLIYDTVTLLREAGRDVDCRPSWGCLPLRRNRLMFNRPLFGLSGVLLVERSSSPMPLWLTSLCPLVCVYYFYEVSREDQVTKPTCAV